MGEGKQWAETRIGQRLLEQILNVKFRVSREWPPKASEQRREDSGCESGELQKQGDQLPSLLKVWSLSPGSSLEIQRLLPRSIHQNLHFIKTLKSPVSTLEFEKQWVSRFLWHPGET